MRLFIARGLFMALASVTLVTSAQALFDRPPKANRSELRLLSKSTQESCGTIFVYAPSSRAYFAHFHNNSSYPFLVYQNPSWGIEQVWIDLNEDGVFEEHFWKSSEFFSKYPQSSFNCDFFD
mgnify:CR=1 FL=1